MIFFYYDVINRFSEDFTDPNYPLNKNIINKTIFTSYFKTHRNVTNKITLWRHRFSEVFTSSKFALDPNHPSYKNTIKIILITFIPQNKFCNVIKHKNNRIMTSQIFWSVYVIQVRSWSESSIIQEHGEHAEIDEGENLEEEEQEKCW